MVLRIMQRKGFWSKTILRLEGRLIAEVAALLESECAELLGERHQVSLDLAGVSFVDRSGTEALQRLSRAGIEILCPSGPVAGVLEGAGVRITVDVEGVDDGRH